VNGKWVTFLRVVYDGFGDDDIIILLIQGIDDIILLLIQGIGYSGHLGSANWKQLEDNTRH